MMENEIGERDLTKGYLLKRRYLPCPTWRRWREEIEGKKREPKMTTVSREEEKQVRFVFSRVVVGGSGEIRWERGGERRKKGKQTPFPLPPQCHHLFSSLFSLLVLHPIMSLIASPSSSHSSSCRHYPNPLPWRARLASCPATSLCAAVNALSM